MFHFRWFPGKHDDKFIEADNLKIVRVFFILFISFVFPHLNVEDDPQTNVVQVG